MRHVLLIILLGAGVFLLPGCTNQDQKEMNLQEKNNAFFAKALNDFFHKRNLESADRNYLLGYIQHNEKVAAMARAHGLTQVEAMKAFFSMFFEAFPDYHVEIENIGAEDD